MFPPLQHPYAPSSTHHPSSSLLLALIPFPPHFPAHLSRIFIAYSPRCSRFPHFYKSHILCPMLILPISHIIHRIYLTNFSSLISYTSVARIYCTRARARTRTRTYGALIACAQNLSPPPHRCMFAYSLMCILIPLPLLNTFARSEHLTHRALNPLRPHHLRIFFSTPSYSEKIFLFTFHVTKKLLRPT